MPPQPDSQHPPKLLEQVVERLRVKHYSLRTEESYVDWINWHGGNPPLNDETACYARFPHPNPPPEGEGANESLREFFAKRFIWFHGKQHPKEMGAPEVAAFLSRCLAIRMFPRR